MADFTDNSSVVLSAADAAIARALEIIGGKCESYAKQEITDVGAVDTGALRNSITHRVDGDTVTVGSNIQYAPYVELGTGKEYQPGPEWIEAQARRGTALGNRALKRRRIPSPLIHIILDVKQARQPSTTFATARGT